MPFSKRICVFLAAIRVRPDITRAARAAGINSSQHYAKLESSSEYAAAFQRAMLEGYDALSDIAVTRATDGWEEPIMSRHGEAMQKDSGPSKTVPGTVRKFDNQLLRFALERRHPAYRERVENSGAIDINIMMDNLNAGRKRVADAKRAREAAAQEPK